MYAFNKHACHKRFHNLRVILVIISKIFKKKKNQGYWQTSVSAAAAHIENLSL